MSISLTVTLSFSGSQTVCPPSVTGSVNARARALEFVRNARCRNAPEAIQKSMIDAGVLYVSVLEMVKPPVARSSSSPF